MKTRSILLHIILPAVLVLAGNARAADLIWIGGTGNWNAAANWSPSQIPGAGDNAFITNNGSYTVTVPAGSTATAGTLAVGGANGTQTLSIDRATLTLSGASVVNRNGQLALTVSQSVVTGAGNLTVNGTLDWANGTMSGAGTTTIASGGVLTIGAGGVTFGRTLNQGGVGTWAGGNLTMSAGVAFNNLAGGTFEITADGRLSGGATTPINNSGLFRQTAGTVSTVINAPFNNGAALQVLAATLSLGLGGTHSGTMTIAPGATLNLSGGSHVLGASSLVTGTGILTVTGGATTLAASGTFDVGSTLSVTAGTVTLTAACVVTGATLNIAGALNYDSSSTVASLNVTAGTLGGAGPINVTGPLTLSGGLVTNALVVANGGLTINGNTTLNGSKLINPGLAIWSAGNITGSNNAVISNLFGATFDNTFDGRADTGTGATPLFVNAGSFRKTGASALQGTTTIDFQFINTGTVEVQTNTLRYASNQQTAGITILNGGDLAVQAQPLQILGGSLVGTGLVTLANTQNLINSAEVSPGLPLGELDISGDYQQTSSGALNIELGGYLAGTNFDLVTVTAGGAGGVATLSGALNVTLSNGFSPTNSALFTFLTAVSRVGSFATFNYPSNDIGMQLSYDSTSGTLKITNLKPVVANPIVDPAAITYGAAFSFQFPADTFTDPDHDTLSYTAAGLPNGLTFTSSTRTFSGTPIQAGIFPVKVMATDNGAPNLAVTNTFTITVNPAPLTISAASESKAYGAVLPFLTASYTGFVNGDTAASLTTPPNVATTGTAGSPVGTYSITASGAVDANYSISYAPGTLTITPVGLTITADNQNKAYGTVLPTLTASYNGFVNGDTSATLSTPPTVTTAAIATSPVGAYSIIPSGAVDANYSISYAQGTLTVAPVGLTVTANSQSKGYGAVLPALTVSYSGFVNGDTAATLSTPPTVATTATANSSVGAYPITASGAVDANYTISYAPGTLTITPVGLTITANNQTMAYGTGLPGLTVSYGGFVNGDTAATLTALPSVITAATAISAVGSYPITASGAVDVNYTITYVPGTLNVSPVPLTVVAADASRAYGQTNPVFTATYVGFVNGETNTALGGSLVLATLADTNSPVGTYPITAGGLSATNYSIIFSNGTLTVLPHALTITAQDRSKIYGAADPTFTASYSGFVDGDTDTALTGTLLFTRQAGAGAGTYAITPSGLSSTNYAIKFVNGTLTIAPASLTITADDQSKAYGAALPALMVSYTGFVNGDSANSLTTPPAVTTTATASSGVGSYPINATGAVDANYTINYAPGTLTVIPVGLTITANNQSKAYGAAMPVLTVSYSGFVNGDTATSLTTPPAVTTTATASSGVGSYPITVSGAVDSNYVLSYAPGTLTVTQVPLFVTADAKTKIQGSSDPTFTAKYSGFVNGDTQAVLGGTLAFTRSPGEDAGNYAITPSGLTSANYDITFNPGTLTIVAAEPEILSLRVGATDVVIAWSSVSNTTYRVQYKGVLDGITWTDLVGDVLASSSTSSKSDLKTTTNRFYRIQVLP